jgi:hypothetical protein
MKISDVDMAELTFAQELLENPSLAARLTNALGTPIEKGFELLPEKWAGQVNQVVEISLQKALQVAVASLRKKARPKSLDRFHTAAVLGTGGIGGAFGLSAMALELPVTTTIMLRSIADIARSEGEDLQEPTGQLACLEVFALGGRSRADDAVETGYYAVRMALGSALADAARHLAQRGLTRDGAPVLIRFISKIAARFGIVVSEKAAAMAVPAIGAVGGSLVNGLFMSHFQNMARGHFKIRRLERKYGAQVIREVYEELLAALSRNPEVRLDTTG